MGKVEATSINSLLSKYDILILNSLVILVFQLDMFSLRMIQKGVRISRAYLIFFRKKIVTGSVAECRVVALWNT